MSAQKAHFVVIGAYFQIRLRFRLGVIHLLPVTNPVPALVPFMCFPTCLKCHHSFSKYQGGRLERGFT